jgi:hypothetical protein
VEDRDDAFRACDEALRRAHRKAIRG